MDYTFRNYFCLFIQEIERYLFVEQHCKAFLLKKSKSKVKLRNCDWKYVFDIATVSMLQGDPNNYNE